MRQYKDADGSLFEVKLKQMTPPDRPEGKYERRILLKGTVYREGALPLPCDILAEKNVKVRLRDGVQIYTDIYRPVTEGKAPGIIAWSPYGKEFPGPPMKDVQLSGLQKFEAPDPAYWVEHGYAVLNPDSRGVGYSEGVFCQWGRQMAEDGCDFVEWTAEQDWCNGKVTFAGTSYLAISQWFIATMQPEGLAAIAPWEGFSDVYRHSLCAGGIPDYEFEKLMFKLTFKGTGAGEDMGTMAEAYPLYNEYWKEKTADLYKVTVPAYVVASYTNKVHTRGTFDAYAGIASEEKWLRIHNTHEWYDFYHNQDDLRRFFDCYLKEEKNDWGETPRVRMSMLNPGGKDIVERPETQFPPQNVSYKDAYLDAESGLALRIPVKEETQVSYCSDDGKGEVSFVLNFEQDVEIAGKLKLRLWMESPDNNDMDLFVMAQKEDKDGNELPVLVEGAPYCPPGEKAPFEWGNGRQRVSMRKSVSVPEYIKPGQIVPVEIELCTMGMIFEKKQRLKITVCGYNPAKPEIPGQSALKTINRGMHIIHTGGRYDSVLMLPVLEG